MMIIPFDNNFIKNGFDSTISELIKEKEILEYILNRALNIRFKLDEQGNEVFTIPKRTKALEGEHKLEGDNVLAFFSEYFLDDDGMYYEIDKVHTSTVFDEYMYWCSRYNEMAVKHRNFVSRFMEHAEEHGYEKKFARVNGKGAQAFIKEM